MTLAGSERCLVDGCARTRGVRIGEVSLCMYKGYVCIRVCCLSCPGTYTVNRSGIYLLRWELCPPTSTTASILSSSTGNGGGGAAVAAGGMAPGSHAVSVTTNTPMAAAGGAAATGPSSSLLSERFWKKANLMYYLEVLQPDRFK